MNSTDRSRLRKVIQGVYRKPEIKLRDPSTRTMQSILMIPKPARKSVDDLAEWLCITGIVKYPRKIPLEI
jgi:hypothetical protein